MQFQTNPKMIRSLIPRITQIAFVVGLLLGVVLGWLFSGLVGTVMRFGLLALLLIPLIAAIFFWWRVRSSNNKGGSGPTVVTWSSGTMPPAQDDIFEQIRRDQRNLEDVVIDLDDVRQERKP